MFDKLIATKHYIFPSECLNTLTGNDATPHFMLESIEISNKYKHLGGLILYTAHCVVYKHCLLCSVVYRAVPQPGRLLQQPYIASIGVTPRASG